MRQGQHDKPAHEDIYVAVRDAFNVAERQLKATDKKHRKGTLDVENFEVLPEASEEETEQLLANEEEGDDALFQADERDIEAGKIRAA